jgi:aspartyl-tRNA(Asn)/glutamyl-tRNA(Gln) amidotransferase subunit B
MEYEAIIGLEVHAQLRTESKLFCRCSTAFGAMPNAQTCPVCLGLPGSLPVLNEGAVHMAVRAALALGCTINQTSIFARKNYFYPDLPKGYQISQFELPLGEAGRVTLLSGERNTSGKIVGRREKSFGITRLHLEEDAGKSIHVGMPDSSDMSYVNLNRCGVPLVEIVSDPDLRTSQEAYDYMTHLRQVLLYLEVCDGNMEEGSLRCDANVSVRPFGSHALGTKVEVKNLNSFRFLQKALEFEIQRQTDLMRNGASVVQETRLWDEAKQCTASMRSKEEAHDYRYFPEPDLPPLKLNPDWLKRMEASLPELPNVKIQRFLSDYGLSEDDALLLTATREMAQYFEDSAGHSRNPRLAANWITGDLAYALKNSGKQIGECPLPASTLAALIELIDSGEISGKIAKRVFEEMYRTGEAPSSVIERLGLSQISDEAGLEPVIDTVLAAHPKQLAEYREGKEKLFGFFVGQAMRETRGQANPKILNKILKKKLSQ